MTGSSFPRRGHSRNQCVQSPGQCVRVCVHVRVCVNLHAQLRDLLQGFPTMHGYELAERPLELSPAAGQL